VMGFSTYGALVTACGSGQPFRLTPSEELVDLCDRCGAAVVIVDTAPSGGSRYPEVDSQDLPDLPIIEFEPDSHGLVYVPSRPYHPSQRDVVFELRPYQGQLALLVYTSSELLEEACGPHQAWVSISSERIEEAAQRVGAETVLFNPVLPEEARYAAPVVDWTRRT